MSGTSCWRRQPDLGNVEDVFRVCEASVTYFAKSVIQDTTCSTTICRSVAETVFRGSSTVQPNLSNNESWAPRVRRVSKMCPSRGIGPIVGFPRRVYST